MLARTILQRRTPECGYICWNWTIAFIATFVPIWQLRDVLSPQYQDGRHLPHRPDVLRETPLRKATQALRVAVSDNPIDFSAGNIAPRFGKSAPLTRINIKCNSARFVPIDSPCVKMTRTLMVWSIMVMGSPVWFLFDYNKIITLWTHYHLLYSHQLAETKDKRLFRKAPLPVMFPSEHRDAVRNAPHLKPCLHCSMSRWASLVRYQTPSVAEIRTELVEVNTLSGWLLGLLTA